jgi:transposase
VAVRSHAVRNVFYERLWAVGKTAKVARTACMRQRLTILNAMRKHHAPWQVQEGPNAYQTKPP